MKKVDLTSKRIRIFALWIVAVACAIFVAFAIKSKVKKERIDVTVSETTYETLAETEEMDLTEAVTTEEEVKDELIDVNSKIRVLISNENGSYILNSFEVSCDTSFCIKHGDDITTYDKDTILTVSKDTLSGGSMVVTPLDVTGRLTINNIKKGGGNPVYRGALEFTRKDDGFYVVNEISVEEYLYGVVSSEVPRSFHEEALKVQAICARGYSYKRILNPMYEKYGANVDDTSSCQVYNNYFETAESIAAVDSTKGQVPMYKGLYIEAFYYSTSSGVSASGYDVWGKKGMKYLTSHTENKKSETVDLSAEEDFVKFIDKSKINGKKVKAFEKDMSMYRWTVTYTNDEIIMAIYSGLSKCNKKDLYYLARQKDGSFKYKLIEGGVPEIGDLKSVEVLKRGKSGIVKELVIKGSKHTIKVVTQSDIRYILCPENVTITSQDGKEQNGWKMLPSAFFYIEKDEENGLYILHGGGFGHGTGMSQNGANAMALKGYTCEEIIKHYYKGVEIVNSIDAKQ